MVDLLSNQGGIQLIIIVSPLACTVHVYEYTCTTMVVRTMVHVHVYVYTYVYSECNNTSYRYTCTS